ncbi:MAG: TIGR04086 family membrane protein [Firmicutes bacterium]|nr:TIGR04086 family membrane protein [Bacillota bacterium]
MKTDRNNAGFSLPAVLKGVLCAVAASGLFVGLAGLTYYFVDLTAPALNRLAAAVLFLSAAAGGAYAGRDAGGRGLLHGLAVGLLYFPLLAASTAWLLPGPLTAASLVPKLVLVTVGGALGGVFGVGPVDSVSRSLRRRG